MTTVSGVSANNAGQDGFDISSIVPTSLRNFSFAGWFFPSTSAVFLNMAKVSGATDLILESKSGHYRFWISYSEAHDHTGGALSASAWAFVGVTVDGAGNLKMWRGADMESFSLTADLDSITEVRVGATTYDNNPASYVGPFAFWNSEVSEANMDAMAAGANIGGYSPTQYFDDLSGAGPHAAAIGSGTATEVGTIGDAPSDPPMDEATPASEATPSPLPFGFTVPAPYSTHIVKTTAGGSSDPLRAVGMRRTI